MKYIDCDYFVAVGWPTRNVQRACCFAALCHQINWWTFCPERLLKNWSFHWLIKTGDWPSFMFKSLANPFGMSHNRGGGRSSCCNWLVYLVLGFLIRDCVFDILNCVFRTVYLVWHICREKSKNVFSSKKMKIVKEQNLRILFNKWWWARFIEWCPL